MPLVSLKYLENMDKVVGGVGMQLVTEMEIVPYYDLVKCGVKSSVRGRQFSICVVPALCIQFSIVQHAMNFSQSCEPTHCCTQN